MSFDTTPGVAAALLLACGVVAGFTNTLAGGGSALSLPLLMLFGLPAEVANGTNRVSVFAQSLAATQSFDRHGRLDRAAAFRIMLPTLGGSLLGAAVASYLPRALLKPLLLAGLLLVALTFVFRAPPITGEQEPIAARGPAHRLVLFTIGVYGGFLQAGVGFFLLAFLGGALRYDLVRANALKLVVVAAFTLVALVVFVIRGQVAWGPGLVLAVGTVVGARLGVRFALAVRGVVIRRFVFVAIVALAGAALFR